MSLDEATLELLAHQTRKEQRSRSAVIRRAVRRYVDEENPDDR